MHAKSFYVNKSTYQKKFFFYKFQLYVTEGSSNHLYSSDMMISH